MTNKISIDRSVVEQAFDAIELGWCAFEMNDYSLEKFETAKTALRAALEQPQVNLPEFPVGWKLVPVEPTTKMIDAARSQSSFPAGVWRAMLAAAPKPPVVEQPQVEQEPVAWQFRMRMVDDEEWPDWCNCLKDVAESCWHTPVLRGRQREARALYTHPHPTRQQQGEVND